MASALDYQPQPPYPGLPPLGATESATQGSRIASSRAKRIFGIPVDQLMRSLSGALTPAIMYGSNFGEGLALGLSGGMGAMDSFAAARAQAEAQKAEAERQQLKDELDRRKIESDIEYTKWRMRDQPGEEPEDIGVVPYGVEGPLGPGQVQAPAGLPRGGFEEFAKQLARNQAEKAVPTPRAGATPPQFSARDRALINKYKLQHPGATDEDAVLDISEGKFGAKPSIIETEQQATDLMRRPLYIGPDGRQTTSSVDPTTGRQNPPMMTKSRRFFGNPEESQFGGNPLEGLIR